MIAAAGEGPGKLMTDLIEPRERRHQVGVVARRCSDFCSASLSVGFAYGCNNLAQRGV
jgi:hypothetical protein